MCKWLSIKKVCLGRYRCLKALYVILCFLCTTYFSEQNVLCDAYVSENTDDYPRIISEIPEMRQTNSDTFLLSDGSYECVVYSDDKYYHSSDGKLVQIDSSIKTERISVDGIQYQYRNTDNSFICRFSNQSVSTLLEYEDNQITFSLMSDMMTETRVGGITEYDDICGYRISGNDCVAYIGADIQTNVVYNIVCNGVKEYIVLDGPNAPYRFDFTVKTTGLRFMTLPDANKVFVDEDGVAIFTLADVFAIDSAGERDDNAQYVVSENVDGSIKLKVSISQDWLNEPGRVFPILIDPTIIITGSGNIADAYVSSRYPSSNYGTSSSLKTGSSSNDYVRRSFLKFDIPSSLDGMYITEAYIRIRKSTGTAPNIRAFRVLSSWSSSTITWNNMPSYDSSDYTAIATPQSNGWYKLNVANLARRWNDGVINNYGVLLKDSSESGTSQWTDFYSSDAASPNKPELHIQYYYPGSRPYQQIDNYDINCMGYAMEYDSFVTMGIDAGDLYGKTKEEILSYVKTKSENWMNSTILSSNYSQIAAWDTDITGNWYKVVLRVGFIDVNGNGIFESGDLYDGYNIWDFHWWYQTNTGDWAEKRGHSISRLIGGTAIVNPANLTWQVGDLNYNSSAVFYKIKDIRTLP